MDNDKLVELKGLLGVFSDSLWELSKSVYNVSTKSSIIKSKLSKRKNSIPMSDFIQSVDVLQKILDGFRDRIIDNQKSLNDENVVGDIESLKTLISESIKLSSKVLDDANSIKTYIDQFGYEGNTITRFVKIKGILNAADVIYKQIRNFHVVVSSSHFIDKLIFSNSIKDVWS